ncbi:MAG TPA: DUF5668 domain-containing protein [Vicinamibacteria bacterium]|nr:DUF5668 domain-containing protein [Vicinamibacteria bacterium]
MIREPEPPLTERLTPRLILGLSLMALGVVFTLDNLRLIEAGRLLRFWPAVLVAIGIQKLLAPGAGARWLAWLWIGIGSWLLAGNLDLISVSFWKLWPGLLILCLGASLAYRALSPARGLRATSEDVVNMFALMGGHVLTSHSQAFRGGDMVAVMGGCELDLRQAGMFDREVVIETVALMGGIEIKVPEDWTVVMKGFPVMGGFEDTTKPRGETGKRLIVRGLALMGGVEVHN